MLDHVEMSGGGGSDLEGSDSGVDPNYYFGGYGVLVIVLLINSFFLDPINEPEIVRMTDEERQLMHEDEKLSSNCNLTFKEIGRLFGYREFLLPILYFLI